MALRLNRASGVTKASGQAAVEYVIVLAFVVIALIAVADGGSAIEALLAAIKSFFKAFSFALSVPAQHGG